MTAVCSRCAAPTERMLCNSCLGQLTGALRALPWLTDELTITLTRQARLVDRDGRRSTDPALPFHAGAAKELGRLGSVLVFVARAIGTARHIELDPVIVAGGILPLGRWLLLWPNEIAIHPDAGEFHQQITSAIERARVTVDRHPDRRYLGPCDRCHKDLYVWVDVDHKGRTTLPDVAVCATTDCQTPYPTDQRRIWLLEKAYDQLLTATDMSRAIGELIPGHSQRITPEVISTWAKRNRIFKYPPHPRDPHRWTRYRVEEVINMARRSLKPKPSG